MIRKIFAVAVVSAFSILASGAGGAELPLVRAECQDHGFSYYDYLFQVTYSNPAVRADSQVDMILGFAGHGSINSGPFRENFSWDDEQTVPAQVDGPGKIEAVTRQYYMATGGYLSDLDFAFRITQKDGSVVWDSGNSSSSDFKGRHFRAHFFTPDKLECFHLQNNQELAVGLHSGS